ncbi:MAG: hypothetical protein QGD91_08130, partial [Actinomycetota bacterium]|nr:hypothetical protein [Actinomycetota bacterium]
DGHPHRAIAVRSSPSGRAKRPTRLRPSGYESDSEGSNSIATCRTDRGGQFFVHLGALFHQLDDSSQRLSVGDPEVGRFNTVSLFL